MLNKKPQLEKALILPSASPTEAVDYINEYIKTKTCEYMSIDISTMNVLDACYVSTICSTTHYVKYPKGKINWLVSSEAVRDFNKNLELGNCNYIL